MIPIPKVPFIEIRRGHLDSDLGETCGKELPLGRLGTEAKAVKVLDTAHAEPTILPKPPGFPWQNESCLRPSVSSRIPIARSSP